LTCEGWFGIAHGVRSWEEAVGHQHPRVPLASRVLERRPCAPPGGACRGRHAHTRCREPCGMSQVTSPV